jgi:hypothetical protein
MSGFSGSMKTNRNFFIHASKPLTTSSKICNSRKKKQALRELTNGMVNLVIPKDCAL